MNKSFTLKNDFGKSETHAFVQKTFHLSDYQSHSNGIQFQELKLKKSLPTQGFISDVLSSQKMRNKRNREL